MTRLVLGVAIGVIAVNTLLAAPQAHAAKEKFERTKPHVNVGTIGRGQSEEALLYLRLNVPAEPSRSQPSCQFHGTLEVREVIAEPGGTGATNRALGTLVLRHRHRVELVEPGAVQIVDLPFEPTSGRPREILQLELIADSPSPRDACALDALLDVHDEETGDSRQQRHTPFFSGYRPQFYFRTTDVSGN